MAASLTIPVRLLAQRPLSETLKAAIRSAAPHATGAPLDTGRWMRHEDAARVLDEIRIFSGYESGSEHPRP